MGQASIANTEALGELIRALHWTVERTDEASRSRLAALETLCAEADNTYLMAKKTLEKAEKAIQRIHSELEDLREERDAMLRASQNDDEDDDDEPDTSEIDAKIEEKENELEEAQFAKKKAESTVEEAGTIRQACHRELDAFRIQCGMARTNLEAGIQEAESHLRAAQQALDAYLAKHPAAAAFARWNAWTPNANTPLTPADIHDRLSISAAVCREAARYFGERAPAFRNLLGSYRERFAAATDYGQRHRVLVQSSRNGSGALAELIVARAFASIGNVSTQNRTCFDDGSFTKTDLIVSDLRVPVILHKGEGGYAPVGGSFAVEIKTGRASYLRNQEEHMKFQAGGHHGCDASCTICSRDIKDLPEKEQEELRRTLREAGSPLFGTLPYKSELDKAIWDSFIHPERNPS